MKDFKKLTAMKAIRAKCLQCSAGQTSEIKECTVKTCALWHFRMGHAPKPAVNALDLRVFADGTGQIYSIRDNCSVDDEEEEEENDRKTRNTTFTW